MRNMQATRERRGMTLRELHELTGIDVGTLSRYENGKREPSIGRAAVVARALGVSLESLTADSSHAGNDADSLDHRGKTHVARPAVVEGSPGDAHREVTNDR